MKHVVLRLKEASASPENLSGYRFPGLSLEFLCQESEVRPRICISNKIPSDAHVTGLGTTVGEPLP